MDDVTEVMEKGIERERAAEGKRHIYAKRQEEIMARWKFEPDRKRGRPSKNWNMGRPRKVDVGIILLLEEATSWGCSEQEARAHAEISQTSFDNFCRLNPDFKMRLAQLRQHPLIIARNSVTLGMKNSGELALKYLERKLPEEFSLKATVQHNLEFTGISLERPKLIESEVIKDDTLEAP